jgi:hypothetical protein
MPVTARLSKLFYDRFDQEVVDELVTWFNSIDSGYRTELRELNAGNFAQFDAKLDKRFADQDAKFEKRFADQDKAIAALRIDLAQGIAALETRLARSHTEHLRWMFTAWTALLIPIIGLWMRG